MVYDILKVGGGKMFIDDIKNLNGEAELNRKILFLCNKNGGNKNEICL